MINKQVPSTDLKPRSGLFISYLSLFTSMGTILCCALPSLLVALGMGASFAGLIGIFPQIVFLSEHKTEVFLISGMLMIISGLILYFNRNAPCPVDPQQARACRVSRKWSIRIVCSAAVFWLIGFFAAYVAPLLFF
jgi:hypothetical protein